MKTSKTRSASMNKINASTERKVSARKNVNANNNTSVKKIVRTKPTFVESLVTDTLKDILIKQTNSTKKVNKLKIAEHVVSMDFKSTKRLSNKKQNNSHLSCKTSGKKQKRVLFNAESTFEPGKTWNPETTSATLSQKKQKLSLYQQCNRSLSRVEQICQQAADTILRTKRKSDETILQQAGTMYELLNKRLTQLQQNQSKFQQNNNARLQKYQTQKQIELKSLKQETLILKSFLEEGQKKNAILQNKYISLQRNLEFVKNDLQKKQSTIRELTQSNRMLRESNVSVTSRFPVFEQYIQELSGNLTIMNAKKIQLQEQILKNQKQKAFIKEHSKFILKNLRQYQNQQEIQFPDMTQQSQNQNFER